MVAYGSLYVISGAVQDGVDRFLQIIGWFGWCYVLSDIGQVSLDGGG